jgi:hypothetical protein
MTEEELAILSVVIIFGAFVSAMLSTDWILAIRAVWDYEEKVG